MATFTSTTTDVDTTTAFTLTSDVIASSGAGDFATNPPPATLTSPTVLDFVNALGDGFDWSDPAGIGSFVAAASVQLPSAEGVSSWNVTGTYTVGTAFDNAGAVVSANMIWSATQTGGAGEAISLSGTFFAPERTIVPEPASLSLLGAGLAGLVLAMRRNRKA